MEKYSVFRQHRQCGMASWAVMAFGTVSILTALGATLAATTTSTRAVSIQNLTKQVNMQADMIRSHIVSCAIGDPATGRIGDNGTGLNPAFPYVGSSTGVKSGGTPAGTSGAVASLYCPRTLSGSSWVVGASDISLWSGYAGVFLPPAPSGFNDWQFASTANSVKISISYAGTSAEMAAVLSRAAAKFGSAEVSTATPNTLVVCIVVNSGSCS